MATSKEKLTKKFSNGIREFGVYKVILNPQMKRNSAGQLLVLRPRSVMKDRPVGLSLRDCFSLKGIMTVFCLIFYSMCWLCSKGPNRPFISTQTHDLRSDLIVQQFTRYSSTTFRHLSIVIPLETGLEIN